MSIYVDLPGFNSPADIYSSILQDITVVQKGRATILELTCCYEKNLETSKLYKLDKYKDPSASSKLQIPFTVLTAEVSSLGFVPVTSLNRF